MSPSVPSPERLAQKIAEQIVSRVVDALDVNALVAKIDVQDVVDRIDVNKVVASVDVEALMDRIDVEAVVARIDVNALMARVDVNALVDKIDVDSLIEQTELGSLIAKSTTGALTQGMDLLRSQGVGLDDFVSRIVNKALRRKGDYPVGPPLLTRPAAALSAGPAVSS
jgi:hypothetical protein